MLEHGALVEVGNTNGTTALMFAIENRHWDTVRVLLRGGASPDTLEWCGGRTARGMMLGAGDTPADVLALCPAKGPTGRAIKLPGHA
jgi:hypothetical protein